MSAIPTLDLAAAATVCPLCDISRKPRAFKKLYGVPVCRKCYYKFANRRQLAYFIDLIAIRVFAAVIAAAIGFMFPEALESLPDQITPIDVFWFFFVWILIPLVFALKDGFSGHSPGKWITGVQVVDRLTREPIGFLQSFKRNLILIIPVVPFIIAFTLAKGPRLGDKWANTEVVWKRYRFKVSFDRRGVLCMKCGYDLTGNVSGRCPECGTDIPAPPRAAMPLVRPVAAAR